LARQPRSGTRVRPLSVALCGMTRSDDRAAGRSRPKAPGRSSRVRGVTVAAVAAALLPTCAILLRAGYARSGSGGGEAGTEEVGTRPASQGFVRLGGGLGQRRPQPNAAQQSWRVQRRSASAAASRGEIVEASSDPFARLTAVIKKSSVDTPARVLDEEVDISNIPLRRALPGMGAMLEQEAILSKDLWSGGGALIMAVRRPGDWFCREAAFALARLIGENPQLSQLNLVAVLKESLANEDGTNEVDLFRDYFPGGELYVDENRGFFRAFGDRNFFPFLSREGIAYARQRADGLKEYNIQGNLNGFMVEPLLLGGIVLVGPGGQVLWAHQEANGPVAFDELEVVATALAQTLAARAISQSIAKEMAALPSQSGTTSQSGSTWLEWAVDGKLDESG